MEQQINPVIKEKKHVTDDNINLTDCRKFVRAMRNCAHCNKENRPEACKKCAPRCVVDEVNAALTAWFRFIKESRKTKLSIVDSKINEEIDPQFDEKVGKVDNYKM